MFEHLPKISEETFFEATVDMFGRFLSEASEEQKKSFAYRYAKNWVLGSGFVIGDVIKAYQERLRIGESEWE